MAPSRLVRIVVASLLLIVAPSLASAATIEFRVLFDVDNDAATGCTVNGMDGVDQVLVTQVTEGAGTMQVTRTHREVCTGSALGGAVDIVTTGWNAGWNETAKLLTIETRIPFSAFGSSDMPDTVHVGFDANRNGSVHTSLANQDGTPVLIPPPPVRRRAMGSTHHITMDGSVADWGRIRPAVIGLASNGTSTLRLLRILAWADSGDDHLYFAATAHLGSDHPYADDNMYLRQPDENLMVGAADGVLKNDALPGKAPGQDLEAVKVSDPTRGTVVLNPDGSFTYSPDHPQLLTDDEFEYKAVGDGKESNVARVVIQVNQGETPNPPADDEYETDEDQNLVEPAPGVLENDFETPSVLDAILVTPPQHGTVTLNADGGFTYKPDPHFFGDDTFVYDAVKKQGAPQGIGGQATVTIHVLPVNDAPQVSPATFTLPENSPNNTIVGDVDAFDIDGDTLTFSIIAGNTGGAFSINASTGQIRVANSAAVDFETNHPFSLTVRVSDGDDDDTATITINLTNTNEAPVIGFGGESSTLTYTENDPPTVIDGTITVSDSDSQITGATVEISNNFAAGQDVLSFTPVGAITGSFVGDTLTLTGTDSAANYQLALQSVTYQNTSENPSTAPRTITWTATDGTFTSAPVTSTINVISANDAPSDIALSGSTVAENQPAGTAVGTFSTTDLDIGETFTYTLAAGAGDTGNASFQIVGDQLRTAASFDFEAQNSYSIRVRSTDSGGLFFEEVFTITVTDVNDAPTDIALSNATVPENQAPGTTIGVLSTTDQDGSDSHTYTLVAGTGDADNARFQIALGNALQNAVNLDFDTQSSYSIRVRSTDAGGLFFEKVFIITVTNVNETPTDIALSNNSVAENQPGGTPVGDFSTIDQDAGDTFTYTLVAGTGDTGNGSFQIVGNQLQTSASFDHEGQSSYSIRIRSTDAGGLFMEEVFVINVTNVNEVPTDIALSGTTVAENQPAGTAVGTFSTTDIDIGDTFTYTLVAGAGDTGNASFQIAGNQLQTAAAFDFEAQNSYSMRVRSTDAGGLFLEEVFTITVTDGNETPTDIQLSNASAPENQPVGTDIGTLTTTDSDAGDTHTYTLVAGTGDTGNASFQIAGDKLQNATNLDFEAQPTYSVRVRSTDAGGLFVEEVFTITITDVNETPVDIALDNASVDENQPAGTAVGNFSTIDPDAGDTFTYTLVAGAGDTGNASFQIVGGQLQTSAMFDTEAQNSYSIRVRSTDAGGLFVEEVFTITVTNVNEAPTDIALSASTIAENQPAGTAVGTFSTTDVDAGDTFTYTLVAGAGDTGNASFQIVGDQIQTSAAFNFEAQNSYSIRVRSTDAGGLFFEEVFTITVTNVNEAPTDIALSNATAPENQAVGTTIGTFSSTDEDTGDTHTYTLVAGTGDADNAKFQIVGGALQNAVNLDFDTQASYSIRVRSTDAGGLFFEEVFTITVTNVNETPTDIALDNASVNENQPAGTAVGNFSTTDPDAGDTFTYTLVAGAGDTGNTSFQIVGGQLQTSAMFDFEAQNSYSIRVRSTDAGGLFFEEVFTISVNNVNEAPTDIALSNATAPENQAIGTTIGTFSTTDIDTGDTHTYTLVAGAGDTDNAKFQIAGNALQNAVNLDFESQTSYSIRVRSTDAGGLFIEEVFTITITNANETPTDIALDNASTPENQPVGTDIGTFTTTDPDVGDTHTYTLVAGTGDTDNGSFQIVGDKLQNATNLNFEAQTTYSVRVRTTDAGGLFFEEVFTITVTDANDAPTDLALSNDTVAENQPSGTAVGTFTTTDQEGGQTHTYTLVAGAGDTGNTSFQIVGNQLQTAASFNFEAQSSYSIRVRTTDDGVPSGFYEEVFTINVTNENEAPTDIALDNSSVAENQPSGSAVGNFSTVDPDTGDTFTYTLVAGAGDTGNTSFQIVGNQLQTSASFNFEVQNSYSIRVRSTDAGGLFFEEVFTITVTNVNETPTDIALSNASINENSGANAVIGMLATTDPDTPDTHTYTLVAGAGDTNNALFNIAGDQLRENASLNFEAGSSYSVRIRTTDAGGLFYEEAFTITVIDVNEPPVAVDDTYNAAGGTLVHIAGSVTLPVPAPVASTGDVHTTPRTTGVKADDTDPDTNPAFNTLTVSHVGATVIPGGGQATLATANGSVTMHSDGSFHFTPNAGFTGTNTFNYTIFDGANSDVGQVTINVHAPAIRYVKNDAPVAGNGTSVSPHQTLAAAISASTAGELIYVMRGDGTATNYGGSNVMKLNQRLWGQAVPLSVTANSVALNLIAATSHSLIGPDAGANPTISIPNTVTGVDIQGLSINGGTTNAVDLTTTATGSAGFTFSSNIVTAAGQEGIDVNAGGSGTATVGISDSSFTTTGTAIDLTRTAGTMIITAFDDLSVSGNTGGSGIVVSGPAQFDSNTGAGGLQAVSGGVLTIGQSGNGVGAGGLVMSSVEGTLNFSNLSIFNDNGTGLGAGGTGTGITVTVNSGGGDTGIINSTGGPAVSASTAALDIRLANLQSTGSATSGISLTTVSGTLNAAVGSAITNATNADVLLSSSSVNFGYAGTITDDQGQLITISGSTGTSTKAFTGAITDGDDGDGTGITLSGNSANTTMRFSGGLVLSTGVAAAFSASGGGIVEVCDDAACDETTAGALINKITTTTGTALNVTSTTIGVNGLEFRSISSNGGGNAGIVLSSTGSSGTGLIVRGNGGVCTSAATCTGGAIQNKTVNGITINDSSDVRLNNMFIDNNDGSGIGGTLATDLVITNSRITNNADTATGTEAGIRFDAMAGTNSLTNTNVTGSSEDEIRITPSSGNFTLNITGGTFGPNSAVTGGNLISLIGTNTANWTFNVTGATFTGARASAIMSNMSNTGKGTVSISGSTFTNNGKGISIGSSQSADHDFDLDGNTLTGSISNAIEYVSSTDATTGSTTRGVINNNIIGNGTSNSGSQNLYGIAIDNRGDSDTILAITGNNVQNSDLSTIFVSVADFGALGGKSAFDLIMTGNTGGQPDDNSVAPIGQVYGMLLDVQDGTTACTRISGNTSAGVVVEDLRVRIRDTAVFRIEGLTDGDATAGEVLSTAATETHLNTLNPGSSPTDASTFAGATGFTEATNGQCRTWPGL